MDICFTQHCGQPSYDQQDSLLVNGKTYQSRNLAVTLISLEPEELLIGVADGVSGSPSAAIASRLILELLFEAFCVRRDLLDNGLAGARLVRHACDFFREKLARRKTYGAATTLAALHIRGSQAAMVNSGDSRVYRVRRSEEHEPEWRQLSRDHTLFADLQSQGKFKSVNPKDVASIYKGLAHCIVADPEEGNVRVQRQIVDIIPGDLFLLMTDGVHETLGDDNLQKLFDPDMGLADQLAQWRAAVLAAGSPDNFSLIALYV